MNHLTDEELMIRINNGNLELMQVLFDRYNLRIYHYSYKLVRDKTLSEDITQESFFKVIKYRQSFKKTSFAAWIFTITRNLCIDHLKTNKANRLHIESIENTIEQSNNEENEKRANLAHLENTLNRLNPIDRELIILSRYEKLKYKEISDVMGMSESAIKTRIHRGLQKLKTLYFKSN